MLLSKKERQRYLAALGLYRGDIDGIEGPLTRAAYKALQDKYFVRKIDKDGIYGPNTDKLLRNAYVVQLHCDNFTLTEFKCDCGGKYCTGYPEVLSEQLLINAQKVRDKFGPTIITSGMRCKPYNNSLVGSSSTSRHLKAKALDVAIVPLTNTLGNRRVVMNFIRGLRGHNYTYCDENGSAPNMGNAIHFDVK